MTEYKPGKLVTYRDRDWIVLPSADPDIIMLKPMGGSEDEITGIFKPLQIAGEQIKEATFPNPTVEDLDDFQSAKLLFDATRLSFRNASGPFRCMGKLSFRPRSYQIVPLVMSLKQDVVRLLVADDVGIGKTIEALIILKEMIERGEVKKFAVICLPHLCEQWQGELKDKLDINAEIIRSSTAASLDRKLPDDRSVFYHIPFQVISIDYIKSDKRRKLFLTDCPELVIVDEAHSCAKPAGASSPAQQQRFHLLHDIAQKETQHLVMLTATPHSGKDAEFQSLLGLLNPEFEKYDLQAIDQNKRKKIANHFILRKRENIKRWLNETTPFPDRDSKEVPYKLSDPYSAFYKAVLNFARGITIEGKKSKSSNMRYWAALSLLRGVMSSPATGLEMLQKRQLRSLDDEEVGTIQELSNPLFEANSSEGENDAPPTEYVDNAGLTNEEWKNLQNLSSEIVSLKGIENDWKAKKAVELIKQWIKEGHNPIVFCKFIPTAKYLGEVLKAQFPKIEVQAITSELADEQRREKIDLMRDHPKRILVATDCLSEGINLQAHFTAVLHYDLPWNPNRLEQREGRVDRFGQSAPEVKAYLLYGQDNPIDLKVLEILIKKVRDIQRSTGVSISLGDENTSIMDALIKDILLGSESKTDTGQQLSMFAEEFYKKELEAAREKANNLKSIFSHESVNKEDIEKNLIEVDQAIGDIKSVEGFVKAGVEHLGGSLTKDEKGYVLSTINLPEHLKSNFKKDRLLISFESPTPAGYKYLGRNHQFVEQLCQFLLSLAFEKNRSYKPIARSSVIQTSSVQRKTCLIQFRVRNVIKEVRGATEVISEEMYLWGYSGSGADATELDFDDAKHLLLEATSKTNLSIERQRDTFQKEEEIFNAKAKDFHQLAEKRAINLVEAHGRFKNLVGGKRYEAVHPVLPPDIMGVYVLLPVPKLSI
jgi:superfamily II DNA/RNA helicase